MTIHAVELYIAWCAGWFLIMCIGVNFYDRRFIKY